MKLLVIKKIHKGDKVVIDGEQGGIGFVGPLKRGDRVRFSQCMTGIKQPLIAGKDYFKYCEFK